MFSRTQLVRERQRRKSAQFRKVTFTKVKTPQKKPLRVFAPFFKLLRKTLENFSGKVPHNVKLFGLLRKTSKKKVKTLKVTFLRTMRSDKKKSAPTLYNCANCLVSTKTKTRFRFSFSRYQYPGLDRPNYEFH